MMDLQKLTLTSTKQFEQPELDSLCQEKMEKYRKHCLEVVRENVEIAKRLLMDNKEPVM